MVIVSPIAILLAVCLIVFLIETNAVAQRKTVVCRQQVNGGRRTFAVTLEEIAGAGKATGKLPSDRSRVSQKRRMASRKWSFHSANSGGKFPT